jgi:opacity protein-like surface antigen
MMIQTSRGSLDTALSFRSSAALAVALAIFGAAPAASAQGVQAQTSGSAGYPPNPAYQPAPAYYPPPKPIENIGRTGQFIFGIERITGVFFDHQTLTYKDPVTRAEDKTTYQSTSFGLLGVDSHSPSALPRFALDYVLLQGLTVGGSFMLSTRGMSIHGGGERTLPPPTANDDGFTVFGTARAGYAYAFDSTFGLWPRLGIAYAHSQSRGELIDPTNGNKSLGSFETSSNLWTLNIEALFAVSPIEHIVVTGGPYLDLGLGGGYNLYQESNQIDQRDARLTSYGLLINAAGYY